MDKTIADLFCDTYVASDPNGKCCYILIPGLENNSRLMNDKSLIFGSGSNPKKLTTFEGKPAYQIRNKFVNEIKRRANSATGVYSCINWLFSEEVVKTYFTTPNLWLLNHNERAGQRNRREEAEINYRRKRTAKTDLELEDDVRFRTRNLSVRTASREMRDLQRKGGH